METMSPSVKTKIIYTDQSNPPPCGPFGRLRWSKKQKRWTYRLNTKGSRAVAKWLAKHRTPLRLARGTRVLRPTYLALLGLGADKCDIEGELLIALASGIARWDDQRGSMSTSIVWQMRNRLNQMIRHQKYRVQEINLSDDGGFDRSEMGDRGFDQFADPKSADPNSQDGCVPQDVKAAIDGLECDRAKKIFLMRFRDDCTLRQIASHVGHTPELMRQVANGALYAVQKSLGVKVTVSPPAVKSRTIGVRQFDLKYDPVVAKKIAEGHSLREIGDELGYTIRIIRNAVDRMRKHGVIPPRKVIPQCPTA